MRCHSTRRYRCHPLSERGKTLIPSFADCRAYGENFHHVNRTIEVERGRTWVLYPAPRWDMVSRSLSSITHTLLVFSCLFNIVHDCTCRVLTDVHTVMLIGEAKSFLPK